MLEGVISSRTKAQILVKLFLNPGTRAYLRALASEFGVSTNSVRLELNNLSANDLLLSQREGRTVYYQANTDHPLFPELSSIVRKITGIDGLVTSILTRLGNLEGAYLTGDYADGRDTGVIDVVLIGEIDRAQLDDVIRKSERYIRRKIRPLVLTQQEFENLAKCGSLWPRMQLWRRGDETKNDQTRSTRRWRP